MPGLASDTDNETDLLLAYLQQQRDGIRNAAFGLTDEQARLTPTAGTLSIGALVTHATAMERTWLDIILERPEGDPYEDSFRWEGTLAEALASYADAANLTDTTIRSISDLNRRVPVPKGAPWFPADVESWSLRWVLLHLIEEIARHAGHADIVRESVDGATMYPLMAAVEGWPTTDWLQPWTPAV